MYGKKVRYILSVFRKTVKGGLNCDKKLSSERMPEWLHT